VITEGRLVIQLSADAREVSREQVQQVADIVGDRSDSADALRRADAHPGPVRFWYSPSLGTLSVELLEGTLQ
jgi:hypothetical protein